MADVIVEKDTSERSSSLGVIVGIVALILVVLAAIYILPSLFGALEASNNSTTGAGTTTTTPATGP